MSKGPSLDVSTNSVDPRNRVINKMDNTSKELTLHKQTFVVDS